MLVSSDNALVAIRMGKHTVNAGRVYFAAGSFELEDFRDGLVDVDFNMHREVKEETGIDIAKASPAKRYYLLSTRSGTVIFRRYRMPMTANAMVSSIKAFVAAEAHPEIEAPVVIHGVSDLPDDLASYMPSLIEWHFANKG
jgi:8-oxo-dGTP pyrophosphatase MutT (NUDIX family)